MYNSIYQVKQAVADNKGILRLSMGELRDAYGASKLGKHILTNISNELAKHGLGHFPFDLPSSQDNRVNIYDCDSPFANFYNLDKPVSNLHEALSRLNQPKMI